MQLVYNLRIRNEKNVYSLSSSSLISLHSAIFSVTFVVDFPNSSNHQSKSRFCSNVFLMTFCSISKTIELLLFHENIWAKKMKTYFDAFHLLFSWKIIQDVNFVCQIMWNDASELYWINKRLFFLILKLLRKFKI